MSETRNSEPPTGMTSEPPTGMTSEPPTGMTSEPPLPGSAGLSGGGVAAIMVVLLLLGVGIVAVSVIAWRKRRGKTPEDYTYPTQTLQTNHIGTAFGMTIASSLLYLVSIFCILLAHTNWVEASFFE